MLGHAANMAMKGSTFVGEVPFSALEIDTSSGNDEKVKALMKVKDIISQHFHVACELSRH